MSRRRLTGHRVRAYLCHVLAGKIVAMITVPIGIALGSLFVSVATVVLGGIGLHHKAGASAMTILQQEVGSLRVECRAAKAAEETCQRELAKLRRHVIALELYFVRKHGYLLPNDDLMLAAGPVGDPEDPEKG